jgi:phospholipase/carboxylesterase
MNWKEFSRGFRFDPFDKRGPEALVVLLHDLGTGATRLIPIAGRWAPSVSTTAFVALNGIEQPHPPSQYGSTEPAILDRAARQLEPVLEQQLRERRLDQSRLVLTGFGYGGTLALHMLLRRGWNCAGVLAFGAKLPRPLPRDLRVDRKVRLIECVSDRHLGRARLRDSVASLTTRGIDARGVLLVGSVLSDETIRHGGAYLVELVGTAQGGERFRAGRESRLAP